MQNGVLGIDLGGTNLRTGLVGPKLRLTRFERRSSAALFRETEHSGEALADYVLDYCERQLGGMLPDAVSVGFPSTLNREKTRLLSTPNLPGFDNLEIVGLLQEKLRVPVFVNRDVNLLMLYDLHVHRLTDRELCIGCYIGTGCGNAIYVRGQLLSGKNGAAGELGHIPIPGNHRRCGCGNLGCAETLASGLYLQELRSRYYPDEEVGTLFSRHAGSPILEQYVEYLSIPIAAEINILDPDCVILGGGVLQMRDFPMDLLTQKIRKHCRRPYPAEALEFVLADPGQENGVIGAGIYAYHCLEGKK